MAKRFPIPEFEHEALRDVPWAAPSPLSVDELRARIDSPGSAGGDAYGAYPVAAGDAFFDALEVRGEHRWAVTCLLPASPVTLTGRSRAWRIQRLVAVEGLPGERAEPVLTWTTPRPMNTRLGPESGVRAPARVLTLVSGHRYDDHWVGNRCVVDGSWSPHGGGGFRVLWADDPERNDFHSVVATFAWDG